jgi:hypothetical protein
MRPWKIRFATSTVVIAITAIAALAWCSPGGKNGDRTSGVNWRNDYFVAARPTGLDSVNSYPASLFKVTGDHKLHLVRQFFKAGEHFSDFANDLHGTIYLAGRTGIYVIHASDPQSATLVRVTHFDDTYCWGAVYGGGTPEGVQYCPNRTVDLVRAEPDAAQPQNGPGSWKAFKHLQFRGENGGPYQAGPPHAEVDGANLVMPYGEKPAVVLAKLPQQADASPQLRRRVSILASTDRYLVIWIQPPALSAAAGPIGATGSRTGTPGLVPHEAPVRVWVLDKGTQRWRSLQLPTAVSTHTHVPVRLFGNWLVTTEMGWSPPVAGTGSASLGIANQQKTPMYSAPSDVQAAYDRRFQNIQIPGKLAIWNLADGRRLTLNTGQEDSEVLAIASGGEMLYRVNDAIYAAKIEGDRIGAPAPVVKAPAVVDIHWTLSGAGQQQGTNQTGGSSARGQD